jgi:membrane protein implicated in regulation of membrane protease activity
MNRYILLGIAAAFLVIGIHQLMILGLTESYIFFMIVAALLLWVQLQNSPSKNTPAKKDTKKSVKK